MQSETLTWQGLTAEDQTDVILTLSGWHLWELENAWYSVDSEGWLIIEDQTEH